MADKILVMGESGSGKSTSTRNLDPETTAYINVIGKPLPFQGWKKKYVKFDKATKKGNLFSCHKHSDILQVFNLIELMPHIKTVIVDDSQYIMSYEFMQRATEKGFDKFSEIAQHMFDVFRAPDSMREDLMVVFLSHSEDVSANGFTKTKIKTIGKMLDEKITVEGLFTIVLLSTSYKDTDKQMKYIFITQSNGTNTAKTPMGMFSEVAIDNDLNKVIKRFHEYNNE